MEHRNDQETIISNAGDLSRIMGVVSSYWDSQDNESVMSSSSFSQGSVLGHGKSVDDKVGYLDRRKSYSSLSELDSSDKQVSPKLVPRKGESIDETLPTNIIPHNVRMITHFDSLPAPIPPPDPPCTLPNISQSPIALIAAASGGQLDVDWLESFDDSTLESLVPRDPHTGRPLSIGSIEHDNGSCRPCIFFLKAKCFKGLRCSFCHFNHSSSKKNLPEDVPGSAVHFEGLVPGNRDSATKHILMKSKRLRPSKRTREMIKQINEQTMFQDFAEDPRGPALSVTGSPIPPNRQEPLGE